MACYRTINTRSLSPGVPWRQGANDEHTGGSYVYTEQRLRSSF
jgi:hypothetical protein